MDLLLKRQQSRNWRGRVVFRLWAKAEMAEDERALIDRYHMGEACLIAADDFNHLKGATAFGFAIFLVSGALTFATSGGIWDGLVMGVLAGVASAFWWLNEKRETIWMRDMLYGRRFKCRSIIELAQKEAMLDNACMALRQVIETAKHWEGVEARPVPVLSPDEAKEVVLRLG